MTERASPMSERTDRIARALAYQLAVDSVFSDNLNCEYYAERLAPLVERAIEAAIELAPPALGTTEGYKCDRMRDAALKALEGKP